MVRWDREHTMLIVASATPTVFVDPITRVRQWQAGSPGDKAHIVGAGSPGSGRTQQKQSLGHMLERTCSLIA